MPSQPEVRRSWVPIFSNWGNNFHKHVFRQRTGHVYQGVCHKHWHTILSPYLSFGYSQMEYYEFIFEEAFSMILLSEESNKIGMLMPIGSFLLLKYKLFLPLFASASVIFHYFFSVCFSCLVGFFFTLSLAFLYGFVFKEIDGFLFEYLNLCPSA